MPNIITLTGPSQSGKSTAIQLLREASFPGYKPITIPKYTTRKPRKDDRPDEVISVHPDKELDVKLGLDLVYQQYGERYGLRSASIVEALKSGETPIIVLNDVRIITEVKRLFGRAVRSVFVYRKAPKRESFYQDSENRSAQDPATIETRLRKAEAIYRIYIENIALFDHVLINNLDTSELELQTRALAESCADKSISYLE